MDEATLAEIKKRLGEGESTEAVKTNLVESGFLDEDADMAIEMATEKLDAGQANPENRQLFSRISLKDVLDRIGFGFSSQQFINILFLLSGASYFFIGIVDGLKTLLAVIYSSILDEHVGRLRKYKHMLTNSGLLYAASFLALAAGILVRNPWVYSAGLLVGTLAAVANGVSYHLLLKKMAKDMKHSYLNKVNHWGIILTVLSIILAAYLLQYASRGATIVLIMAALAFGVSSLVASSLKEGLHQEKHKKTFTQVVANHYSDTIERVGHFLRNKVMLTLLITGAVTSVVQTLGGAYYGIYLFTDMRHVGFGSYMNVGLIFVFALVGTYLGSFVTQTNAKEYGKFPMLVFGIMLVAIMPVTFFFNQNIIALSMATMLGMIGANIVGIARSLLTVELLNESERESFYNASGVLSTLPYIIFVPLGAWIAQNFGLRPLFLILGMALIIVVMPLYFTIVVSYNNKNKV